jgi:hypothetical protein
MVDEKTLFEYAKELKEYCTNQSCVNCVFCALLSDDCVLDKYPRDWRLDRIPVISAVKLLKEMRENISGLDGNEAAKNKVTALTMAIEALGGRDDD